MIAFGEDGNVLKYTRALRARFIENSVGRHTLRENRMAFYDSCIVWHVAKLVTELAGHHFIFPIPWTPTLRHGPFYVQPLTHFGNRRHPVS